MKKSRLKTRKPNISPIQEVIGEMFGKVGDVWEKFKKINFKLLATYLVLLYVLPQFFSWLSSGTTLIVAKSLSMLLVVKLPLEYFLPTEQLYRKSSDPQYSYVEYFFLYLSHSVFHLFVMEVFGGAGSLLGFLTGFLVCVVALPAARRAQK